MSLVLWYYFRRHVPLTAKRWIGNRSSPLPLTLYILSRLAHGLNQCDHHRHFSPAQHHPQLSSIS